MRVNKEDEELVKMVNPKLKRRETILFFLIVVINGLKCIVSDIRLDTCARGRWRVEVSKLEMNQPLGSSYLCRGCSSHTTLVGLLYPGGDKSKKVCTGYKVYPTKGLNLLKESECRASVQIVLCNSFIYTNNIQKYYLVSRCVIFIIIVIAPTDSNVKNKQTPFPKIKNPLISIVTKTKTSKINMIPMTKTIKPISKNQYSDQRIIDQPFQPTNI